MLGVGSVVKKLRQHLFLLTETKEVLEQAWSTYQKNNGPLPLAVETAQHISSNQSQGIYGRENHLSGFLRKSNVLSGQQTESAVQLQTLL